MKDSVKFFRKRFEDVSDQHPAGVYIALPDDDYDWEVMETVFDHHPTFDGHRIMYFVNLYRIGGMTVIRDMLPTAKKVKDMEDQIRELDHEKYVLMLKIEHIKKGGRA